MDQGEYISSSEGEEVKLRVERRQLEYVLQAARFRKDGVHIFEKITKECGIRAVSIDPNFKVGARSKKDPTVWITGEPGNVDSVFKARDVLIRLFDTKANKITLKVDIPHEHHFFVIGKKGEHVKKVMSTTGCHVHFPDTNRMSRSSPPQVKDLVSITGSPDSVEDARRQVRGLLPLTISFDVPENIPPTDVRPTPQISEIGSRHGVTIFFKQRTGRGPLALVKGTRNRAHIVEMAARDLLKHWNPSGELHAYTLQVDISCPHHSHIIGKGGATIQQIKDATETSIRFPHTHHDSAVFINGPSEGTKAAFSFLQGHLPIIMSFEMSEEASSNFIAKASEQGMDFEAFAQRVLMDYDVTMYMKLKGNVIFVTLKTVEAKLVEIHRARVTLLNLSGQSDDYGLSDLDLRDPKLREVMDDPLFFSSVCLAKSYDVRLLQQEPLGSEFAEGRVFWTSGPVIVSHHNDEPSSAPATPNSRMSRSGSDESEGTRQHMQGLSSPFAESSRSDQSNHSTPETAKKLVLAPAGPKTFVSSQAPSPMSYEQKKKLAEKAIHNPDLSRVRTPSSYFAGSGFSRSMPESEFKRQQKLAYTQRMPTIKAASPVSPNGKYPWRPSDRLSATLASRSPQPQQHQKKSPSPTINDPVAEYWNVTSLEELLTKLKLPQYISVFVEQEVDLATFLTLSDMDLSELGIKTFGARRKMSVAIAQLKQMHAKDGDFLASVLSYTIAASSVGDPRSRSSSTAVSPQPANVSPQTSPRSIKRPDGLSQSLSASMFRRNVSLT